MKDIDRSGVMIESVLDEKYEKKGYLYDDYRMFYLIDQEDREFDNHYHEFDKIILFLNGDVSYTIEGKSYELIEKDIILVRHGDIHKVKIGSNIPYERIVMYISPEYLKIYDKEHFHLDQCFLEAKERYSYVIRLKGKEKNPINRLITQMKEVLEQEHKDDAAEALFQKTLLIQFLILLKKAIGDGLFYYIDTEHCNKKIVEIIQYINAHLTEELNIDLLAEQFYLSKYYMMRQFKKETGYTVGSYINNKRLLYARELIQKGEALTQVCFECGFKEYSSFHRAYKKLFGISPVKSREDEI